MSDKVLYPEGVALILGGSGGLGAACAKQIADEGNTVAITYRGNKEAADALLAKLKPGDHSSHCLDVSDANACLELINQLVQRHKRVNSFVYAVGSNIEQPLVGEISSEQWSQVMRNDVDGFLNCVQPLIKHMREQGGGSLVHVSSAGLGKTPPRDALSIAPKAAIDALLKTIAAEEGVNGIRANSVGVGVIEAGVFKRLEAKGVFDENWKAAVKAALPLGCFGAAEDIAEAVAFFASNRSKYITGQRLYVDGGYSN